MHSTTHTFEFAHQQKLGHDQLNQSHAKVQYSYPNQMNLQDQNKSHHKQDPKKLGKEINQIASQLGISNKLNLTKGEQIQIIPDKHSVVSLLGIENSKKKGFTFSLGRDEIKFRQIGTNKINPGPGYYESEDFNKQRKYMFSIAQKTINPLLLCTSQYVPGPAQYELQGMNRTGSYFLSKHNGSKASVFAPPTSSRFQYQNKNRFIPGPGSYGYETMTNQGRYHNSKLRSASGGRFSIEPRIVDYTNKDAINSPGPGAYRGISDFGISQTQIGGIPRGFQKSMSVQSYKNSISMRSASKDPTRISQSNSHIDISKQNINNNININNKHNQKVSA